MITIGLTGGIGMGKSTTAKLFAEFGVLIWDADAAVHRLYSTGGAAVEEILSEFPTVGSVETGIDRALLAQQLVDNEEGFEILEDIVHPLVAEDRYEFLDIAEEEGVEMVLCDIPLLLEGGDVEEVFDAIVVVTAPEEVRRARVLERPGMTQEKYDAIVARQMPDDEKQDQADYLIFTDSGEENARAQVEEVIDLIRENAASY